MAVKDDKPNGDAVQDKKDAGKGKKGTKDEDKEQELSEEDQQLKANLELMVERVSDPEAGVQKLALNSIITEIRTATATMTSVPKPLKFLSPHIDALKARCEQMPAGENKQLLADIVSVMCTTVGLKEGVRDALKFRLQGRQAELEIWGHEYMRHLAGEIAEEYKERRDAGLPLDQLLDLVQQIVKHHMGHNAEPEAVDLLLEVERLDLLPTFVDEKNAGRTCMYLVSLCHYLPEPDDMAVLKAAHTIYSTQNRHHDALRVALHVNKRDLIESTFAACNDMLAKKQMCYLLARHGYRLNLEEGAAAVADDTEREVLREIISNSRLSEHYLALARDLDVMEPKVPEDVYKSHLTEGHPSSNAANVDSARANLASSFVNGFVNAGFGQDKLITPTAEGSGQVHWIFKNKDHGKTSATASLGLITLWDVEGGLPQIDKYLYSTDNYVVAGALLAIGIVNCGVQNENDPAFALISDYVSNADQTIRSGAILGLGLAYAGSEREEVAELLIPLVSDPDTPMEVVGLSAVALGLVFTSSAKDDIVMALLQALMMRSEAELVGPGAKQLVLGLGLMFLGKQELVEATLEVSKTLDEHVSKFAQAFLQACAYAGTGDVLIVQQFLASCGEHIEGGTEEGKEWTAVHQSAAVLGLAMVAMAEPLGSTMAARSLEHLLQYGDPAVRRAVPLALALLNVSAPDISAMDTLSRLSHDADTEVAGAAVLSLGIIGAGTNNARLAGLLRSLATYYYKEPSILFLVRVAQGLVHMGKGLITLSPYHTDRQLLSGMALSGLLAVLISGLDMKTTIGGKQHYLLYALAAAMQPRMLMTLDEDGKMLAVPCRVGQAVDVVAQAGKPKTITGFQTHNTPVLMSAGERAELGTEQYIAVSPILEGLVILKKNPDYMED